MLKQGDLIQSKCIKVLKGGKKTCKDENKVLEVLNIGYNTLALQDIKDNTLWYCFSKRVKKASALVVKAYLLKS